MSVIVVLKLRMPIFLLLIVINFNAQSQVPEKINNQELANLVLPSQVVYQLRKKYGVDGSVKLSKALWRVLNSFSNQQQANSIWQTAISSIKADPIENNSSVLDSHYNTGQLLSKYTQGMTAKNWHDNRVGFRINKNSLKEFFEVSDVVTVYMNLTSVWAVLLNDVAKQESIQWNQVFKESLDLFAEPVGSLVADDALLAKNTQFFGTLLLNKGMDDESLDFADIMRQSEYSEHAQLYKGLVKFLIYKQSHNYLSASFAWFSLTEQFYLNSNDLHDKEKESLFSFVEENDVWFLSKEDELLNVDEKLPKLVEDSIHQLKIYLSSHTKDSSEWSQKLPTVYDLVVENLDGYILGPFRQRIKDNLEICMNISEEFLPFPQQPIDIKQFNGCIKDFTVTLMEDATSRELSGSLTKIDEDSALDRSLELPPWQNINVAYANIIKGSCMKESQHLVNPFEWVISAEMLLWFADRWPAYMKQLDNEVLVRQVINQGEILANLSHCIKKDRIEILDESYLKIIKSWQKVKAQINLVENEFEESGLSIGSDVDLLSSFDKISNYKPENEYIEACNALKSCGVHVKLGSSRALYSLFPNHILTATQLKMGNLNLCYDNVGWENRRSTSTHLDNDNVANYYGNFSFSLKGFYNDDLVFERKIIDKEEYLYLFAENSEAVLEKYCPSSLIGKKISTKLKRGTFGLVPNRLTFLTASRVDETKILSGNWSKGEEWESKIISQDYKVISEDNLSHLVAEVQESYQLLAKKLQNTIYQSLLGLLANPSIIQKQLTQDFKAVTRAKKQFFTQNYLLQMEDLYIDDDLHGIFFGQNKIPDYQVIQHNYENQVNINQSIINFDEGLDFNKIKWNALNKKMSNSFINKLLFQLRYLP